MNCPINIRKLKYRVSLILALWSFICVNDFAQQPQLIWLGTLGGNESEARAVSADGSVIVGVANDANDNPRAFRWTLQTGMQDLGTLGGDWSEATDVSADGSVIVGWSYDANDIYRAFKWTESTGMQDLGAGDYSKAYGVSDDGSAIIIDIYPSAYRWTQIGGLVDLGNLGGSSSSATDISADGSLICGHSYVTAGDPYAFRWVEGIGLEQIGTYYSFARGISGDGNTITGSETGSAGLHRAFRWTQSGGFEFNIAGNFSQGNAVSGDGSIIVGDYANGAFRFSNAGGLEALNQVYSNLLSPGSDLFIALDISSDGQFIIGQGTNGTTSRDEGYMIAVNGLSDVDESVEFPIDFELSQNFPNPFNPSTTIRYALPNESKVSITVFNLLGQEVANLVNEVEPAGNHEVLFNAVNLSSGVYLYRINAVSTDGSREYSMTKKLTLLK